MEVAMSNVLRITVRFLIPEPSFHGKRDGGEPEWPPSPLRLFQALVDASASRWRGSQFDDYAKPALEQLQLLTPEIVAPSHVVGTPFRTAVPNNDLDVWAGPISKGNEPKKQPNELKTMKTIQPVRIRLGEGQDRNSLHFMYPLPDLPPDKGQEFVNITGAAARSITHLGWGIDMVAADADVISEEEAAKLPGHRWRAVSAGGVPLRVPKAGTLDDLMRKHQAFLGRLSGDGFKPVPPLSCFDLVHFHSPTGGGPTPMRPVAAFEIHRTIEDQEKPEYAGKSKFRPFHHVRRVATVAGMVRHATATVARRIGWSDDDVMRRVEGHGDDKDGQSTSDDRLLFLPLPSMQPVIGVGAIRRVLVVGPPGFDIASLRRQLNGQELIDCDTGEPVAMLSGIANTDKNVMPFVDQSTTWSSVTPVILPGFDDPDGLRKKLRERVNAEEQKNLLARLDARILALIWKAFHHAGWTADALAGASVEYRNVGWFRGLDLAKAYDLPPLKFPRYHLRVTFPRPVRGPMAIGAGRYRGFGLLARE
jgi:CRISPR-associated protein Csb2